MVNSLATVPLSFFTNHVALASGAEAGASARTGPGAAGAIVITPSIPVWGSAGISVGTKIANMTVIKSNASPAPGNFIIETYPHPHWTVKDLAAPRIIRIDANRKHTYLVKFVF